MGLGCGRVPGEVECGAAEGDAEGARRERLALAQAEEREDLREGGEAVEEHRDRDELREGKRARHREKRLR